MEKSISFLVPTLGTREMELNRLFNSLVDQTNQSFEVIIVPQDNFDIVSGIVKGYEDLLCIKVVQCKMKGLSVARNAGLPFCKGKIIVLSDDDCWYPNNAVEVITSSFDNTDVLLTQIYDPISGVKYKDYSSSEKVISSEFDVLSRSSIEIAFLNRYQIQFDEKFGLGAEYICCEEVDFLLQLYSNNAKIKYIPITSVYHAKKKEAPSVNQVIAKGALYSKNYNM